jgi:diamine N-acetyltransferase
MLLRATIPADLVQVTAWEAQPDTSAWLGETGPAWHERALADPGQRHLIAEEVGAPVGFAVLAGLHSVDWADRADRAIELRRMVVSVGSRGAGHGRAMLRAVFARARDEYHATRVWLDVKPQNLRARRLYESEGFVPAQPLPVAVTTPNDLIILTRPARRA